MSFFKSKKDEPLKTELDLVKMSVDDIVDYFVSTTNTFSKPKKLFDISDKNSLINHATRAISILALKQKVEPRDLHHSFILKLQQNGVTKRYVKDIRTSPTTDNQKQSIRSNNKSSGLKSFKDFDDKDDVNINTARGFYGWL